jgi:hypothetical protein
VLGSNHRCQKSGTAASALPSTASWWTTARTREPGRGDGSLHCIRSTSPSIPLYPPAVLTNRLLALGDNAHFCRSAVRRRRYVLVIKTLPKGLVELKLLRQHLQRIHAPFYLTALAYGEGRGDGDAVAIFDTAPQEMAVGNRRCVPYCWLPLSSNDCFHIVYYTHSLYTIAFYPRIFIVLLYVFICAAGGLVSTTHIYPIQPTHSLVYWLRLLFKYLNSTMAGTNSAIYLECCPTSYWWGDWYSYRRFHSNKR